MARLAAKLLDHRRREGSLPATVEAIDPLTGRPFVLRREAGKVFLVSPDSKAVENDDLRWVISGR